MRAKEDHVERRCVGCGEFDTPERDPHCYAQHDSRSGHVDVDVDENGIAIPNESKGGEECDTLSD